MSSGLSVHVDGKYKAHDGRGECSAMYSKHDRNYTRIVKYLLFIDIHIRLVVLTWYL